MFCMAWDKTITRFLPCLYILTESKSSFPLSWDLISGTFINTSSVAPGLSCGTDGVLSSHNPALCWGRIQCTKWHLVFRTVSIIESTWNLTCKHIDRFLSPAVPDINVLLILPTLRNDVDPSIPTIDPLTIPATGAFTLLKSSFIFCLKK